MDNALFSIIIPTMNRTNSLINTIISIMNSSYLPDEIIIIDQSDDIDTFKDNEKKVHSTAKGINVKYIYLEEPSLTKARNIGVKASSNDIMIFMDDDIEVEKDTFYNVNKLMQEENISMIAGLNELDRNDNSYLGYIFLHKSFFYRKIGHVTKSMFGRYPNNIKTTVETQWAMGYFFVVRKVLLEKWDVKWDEKLISYAYPEDLDFSYSYYKNSKKYGMRCILSPKVVVKHLCSQEYRVQSFKKTVMYIVNREYLSYKHFNKSIISRVMIRWANFGEFLKRLVKKEAPLDIIRAQYYCDKYRKDIRSGNLHYELYDL